MESYSRLAESFGRLLANEVSNRSDAGASTPVPPDNEIRQCLIILLVQPLLPILIDAAGKVGQPEVGDYWASRVKTLAHQLSILGAFLRYVPYGDGAKSAIQSVMVNGFKLLGDPKTPPQIISSFSGFVQDLLRGPHQQKPFATVYLKPLIAVVHAAVQRCPDVAWLDFCKCLVLELGGEYRSVFAGMVDGLAKMIAPKLVAALRQKQSKVQFAGGTVQCHGLLVGLLELFNHFQGACGKSVYSLQAFDTYLSIAIACLGHFARDMRLGMMVSALLNQAARTLRLSNDAVRLVLTMLTVVCEARHSKMHIRHVTLCEV